MVRPERPSRLYSTCADAIPARGGPVPGPALSQRPVGTTGLLYSWASALGKRQRRIIVERLTPYQTAPLGLSFGSFSAIARLIRRLRNTEPTRKNRKNAISSRLV